MDQKGIVFHQDCFSFVVDERELSLTGLDCDCTYHFLTVNEDGEKVELCLPEYDAQVREFVANKAGAG